MGGAAGVAGSGAGAGGSLRCAQAANSTAEDASTKARRSPPEGTAKVNAAIGLEGMAVMKALLSRRFWEQCNKTARFAGFPA
jgi:hypothetical protein